jgi:ribosomal protein S18 acetylase RimI-like enzyme
MKHAIRQLYYFFRPARLLTFSGSPTSELASRDSTLVSLSLQSLLHSTILISKVAALASCPVDVIEQRLRDGHLLFVKNEQDQPVGYFWYSTEGLIVPWEKNHSLKVASKTAYIWDCKIAPDYRGRGFYRAALMELLSFANMRSCASVSIYCSQTNTASKKAIEKAGFKRKGHLSIWPISSRHSLLASGSSVRLIGPEVASELLFF